jgi:hypothetical protein
MMFQISCRLKSFRIMHMREDMTQGKKKSKMGYNTPFSNVSSEVLQKTEIKIIIIISLNC